MDGRVVSIGTCTLHALTMHSTLELRYTVRLNLGEGGIAAV